MKEIFTPDDPVMCGLCDKETSVAMIVIHLRDEHGIEPEEIANAPILDETEAEEA